MPVKVTRTTKITIGDRESVTFENVDSNEWEVTMTMLVSNGSNSPVDGYDEEEATIYLNKDEIEEFAHQITEALGWK